MPIIAGQITGSALTASVDYTLLANIPAGIVSGAAQVAPLLPAGTVSSSGQVDYNSITNKLSGVVSSSTQVQPLLPGGTVSASNQVDITATTNYSTFSSSLATVDVGQTTRIDNLASLTSSYAINSTIQGQLAGVVSSSTQVQPLLPGGTVSSSGQVNITATTGYSTFSSSIATKNDTQDISIGALNAATSSYAVNATIQGQLANVVSSSAQVKPLLPADTVSSSGQVSITATTGYSTFSSSIATKNDTQDVSINALNAATSSYAINATIQGQLANVVSSSTQVKPLLPGGTVSASGQVDITATTNYSTFSSSLATVDAGQTTRIDNLASLTSSYAINATIQSQLAGVVSSSAQVKPLLPDGTVSSSGQVVVQNTTGIGALATTGSNTFTANQTITGSLFISQNLTVLGSSSISYISQSTLNIGTNVITMNTNTPGTRFGGIEVIDSGSSPLRSGSLYFDSINDQWIFVHQNTAGGTTSSVVVMGPATFNNIGNETYLTQNRVLKSAGLEHITDSQITDNGVTVSITNGLSVGTNLTASNATISGLTANQAVFTDANDTLVSVATTGTGDVVRAASPTLTGTLSAANITATGTMLLAGIISQSSQVSLTGTTGYSTFSSSIATKNDLQDVSINALNAATSSYAVNSTIQGQLAGVVSSSTQVKPLLPGGTVSASGQVDITATTGYSTFSSSLATVDDGQTTRIDNLASLTSSYAINSTIQSQLAGVASSSAQVKAYLPADTVSSSTQVVAGIANQTIAPTNVNATNILSGSVLQTGTNALIGGKLAVTGALEVTGTVTASNLNANQAVFTNASDGLVSNAITGTGNVVMSASPTLTGTLTAANITANGTLLLQGIYSSSTQVDYNSIQNKLSGVISSSTQFNALTGTSASFAATASFVNTLLQTVSASGDIAAGVNLVSNFSSGDEGGEIQLARPQTNSSISGSVTIDIYQNKLRIFEANSPNRGAFIDFTGLASGVNRNLLGNDGIVSSSAQVKPLLPGGTVTSSAASSPSQGTVRISINGVDTDVDTGLQTGDSPTLTGLTVTNLNASQAVFTNGSDLLVSNAITGTGNVVMSASPTLTGTITADKMVMSGSQFAGIVSGSGTQYRLVVPVGTNQYAT